MEPLFAPAQGRTLALLESVSESREGARCQPVPQMSLSYESCSRAHPRRCATTEPNEPRGDVALRGSFNLEHRRASADRKRRGFGSISVAACGLRDHR